MISKLMILNKKRYDWLLMWTWRQTNGYQWSRNCAKRQVCFFNDNHQNQKPYLTNNHMTNFTTTLFFTYLYANQNHHTLKAKKPKLYHRASSYHYFHFASYFIHSSSTHLFHQSLAQCTKPNPSVNLNCTIKIEQTDRPTHNLQIYKCGQDTWEAFYYYVSGDE